MGTGDGAPTPNPPGLHPTGSSCAPGAALGLPRHRNRCARASGPACTPWDRDCRGLDCQGCQGLPGTARDCACTWELAMCSLCTQLLCCAQHPPSPETQRPSPPSHDRRSTPGKQQNEDIAYEGRSCRVIRNVVSKLETYSCGE